VTPATRLIQQLSHNKGLTDEEVRRLKGQLAVVEAEYKASEREWVFHCKTTCANALAG
jgi:hypothetical protein